MTFRLPLGRYNAREHITPKKAAPQRVEGAGGAGARTESDD
jgi:hypothetical protein